MKKKFAVMVNVSNMQLFFIFTFIDDFGCGYELTLWCDECRISLVQRRTAGYTVSTFFDVVCGRDTLNYSTTKVFIRDRQYNAA